MTLFLNILTNLKTNKQNANLDKIKVLETIGGEMLQKKDLCYVKKVGEKNDKDENNNNGDRMDIDDDQ